MFTVLTYHLLLSSKQIQNSDQVQSVVFTGNGTNQQPSLGPGDRLILIFSADLVGGKGYDITLSKNSGPDSPFKWDFSVPDNPPGGPFTSTNPFHVVVPYVFRPSSTSTLVLDVGFWIRKAGKPVHLSKPLSLKLSTQHINHAPISLPASGDVVVDRKLMAHLCSVGPAVVSITSTGEQTGSTASENSRIDNQLSNPSTLQVGSGIVLNGAGLVVTCAHVVAGRSRFTVRTDGETYAAVPLSFPADVKENSEEDVAFLQLTADHGQPLPKVAARLFDSGPQKSDQTEKLRADAIGFPRDFRWSRVNFAGHIATDNIISLDSQKDCPEGMSGGAVVSDAGDVVGMIRKTGGEFVPTATIRKYLALVQAPDRLKKEEPSELIPESVVSGEKLDNQADEQLFEALSALFSRSSASAADLFSTLLFDEDERLRGISRAELTELGDLGPITVSTALRRWLDEEPGNRTHVGDREIWELVQEADLGGMIDSDIRDKLLKYENDQPLIESALLSLSKKSFGELTPSEHDQIMSYTKDYWLAPAALSCLTKMCINSHKKKENANVWSQEFMAYLYHARRNCNLRLKRAAAEATSLVDPAGLADIERRLLSTREFVHDRCDAALVLGWCFNKQDSADVLPVESALAQVLLNSDETPDVRAAAARGLGSLGTDQALQVLATYLNGSRKYGLIEFQFIPRGWNSPAIDVDGQTLQENSRTKRRVIEGLCLFGRSGWQEVVDAIEGEKNRDHAVTGRLLTQDALNELGRGGLLPDTAYKFFSDKGITVEAPQIKADTFNPEIGKTVEAAKGKGPEAVAASYALASYVAGIKDRQKFIDLEKCWKDGTYLLRVNRDIFPVDLLADRKHWKWDDRRAVNERLIRLGKRQELLSIGA